MKRKTDEYERSIFRRFVRAVNLPINPWSVRSLKPPFPDISCRLNGVPHYFELTRMVERAFANSMGHHLSQLTRTGSVAPLADIYDDRAALKETIERKARKTYQRLGRPVALLIYIDGVSSSKDAFLVGTDDSWERRTPKALGRNLALRCCL